jgi:hypothetical protein
MAGLVPAMMAIAGREEKDVDDGDKRGHDVERFVLRH